MANILIVDASPLIYANYNALVVKQKFSNSEGESTGLRFGFLRSIRSYAEKTKADRIAICYDLPGKVKKADGHETYKADRQVTDEKRDMWSQIPALKEMLRLTRYAQCHAEGYEADDVIGHLANKFADSGHDVYIVSTDNDLLQLITPKIKIWMPPKSGINKGKPWFKDEDYCREKFGVAPMHLLHFRALTGDQSDNLQGPFPSESHKEMLRSVFSRLPKVKMDATEFLTRTQLTMSVAHEQNYRANYDLMRLHEPENLVIERGEKNPGALTALLSRLEIKSLIPHVPTFTGVEVEGMTAEEG